MDPTLDEFLSRPNVDPSPAISISFTHAVFIVLRRMPSFNGRTRSGRPVSSSSSTLVTCLSNHSLSENSFHSRDPKRSENSNGGKDLSNHPRRAKKQDLRPLCDHFDLISNYKSQSYPIVATDHATIPENIDDERGLRSSNKERERERTFLGGGRSPRCNRALAAGGYFRMQTDFEFTVGRNSMGAPPKGIPTYLLEAPDLPSASCLCLRRKRYFFGYHPVENCASPLA